MGIDIWSISADVRESEIFSGNVKIDSFLSRDRMAFMSASGKDLPIAIASPTDFIVVVNRGSASWNFSKANLGAFTTT